ncbi:MAG: phosphoribosyl 1,2-cyclic phosphodiesterase [Myxococcota bacterium]|jgi:phosphoribosyl 1,2-cyclic phosphodiesterase
MQVTPKPQFTVKFWGVRGSIPTPGPSTLRYGGNTVCLEVRMGDAIMAVDAGSGAREMSRALVEEHAGKPIAVTFLFSHMHSDHIGGFPFFSPIYDPRTRIHIVADGTKSVGTRDALIRQMSFPLFPIEFDAIGAELTFQDIAPGDSFVLGPAKISTCNLLHPGGALAYRIDFGGRSYVHMSDVEHETEVPDPTLVALCKDADYLTYDSMYIEGVDYEAHRGWGHSSWQAGTRLADAANVGTLIAIHHAPEHDDEMMDRIAAQLEKARPGSVVAIEGTTLDVHTGVFQ